MVRAIKCRRRPRDLMHPNVFAHGGGWPPAVLPPPPPRAVWERNERSVTPPPPRAPSPSYVAVAEQAPSKIEDPSALKKLLVLDLNGTLLHRSPHIPRPKTRNRQPHEERPRDEHGNLLPRLRPVHPRPYMPAFRSYLFAPQTRSWLDVMVWSSAQPHSVDDMVDKCFGEDKERLFAVWARDTLGLSNDHYHRKVQTVKDLAKPWSLLSTQSAHISSSPHSSIASTPRSSPTPSSPSRPSDGSVPFTPQAHSALTTLLLDDSPRKAELQPYNHVCIGEYSGERRAKDLESLQKEQEWSSAVEARQQLDAQMVNVQNIRATKNVAAPEDSPEALLPSDGAEPVPDVASEATAEDVALPADGAETSKKRKRKEKKLQRRAALLEQLDADGKPEVSYDETLLAVIGVLDEIKAQANVAAWIRSGGLWGPFGPPTVRSPHMHASADDSHSCPGAEKAHSSDTVQEEAATQSDNSDLSVENARPSGASAQPMSEQHGKTEKRRKKRQRMPDSLSKDAGAKDAGNDEETVARASAPSPVNAEEGVEEGPQKMWFEDQRVLDFWAARGRRALEELGIPVEHGIER
ncbi:hypothetical protein BV20DRAFT_531534 [Pilatotrama ljubarskyi]|nr:hypothetical protein BV20DRAFT_531534 [Pilatotrama ljubarskyi]